MSLVGCRIMCRLRAHRMKKFDCLRKVIESDTHIDKTIVKHFIWPLSKLIWEFIHLVKQRECLIHLSVSS